jgi:hypothetical protein
MSVKGQCKVCASEPIRQHVADMIASHMTLAAISGELAKEGIEIHPATLSRHRAKCLTKPAAMDECLDDADEFSRRILGEYLRAYKETGQPRFLENADKLNERRLQQKAATEQKFEPLSADEALGLAKQVIVGAVRENTPDIRDWLEEQMGRWHDLHDAKLITDTPTNGQPPASAASAATNEGEGI